MAKPEISFAILSLLESLHAQGHEAVSPGQIKKQLGESRATINRYLKQLVDDKKLVPTGKGPATKYRLPATHVTAVVETVEATDRAQAFLSPTLSPEALELRAKLNQPLGARPHVSYQRKFVDDYAPNTSSLLPVASGDPLRRRSNDRRQPAATYAEKCSNSYSLTSPGLVRLEAIAILSRPGAFQDRARRSDVSTQTR